MLNRWSYGWSLVSGSSSSSSTSGQPSIEDSPLAICISKRRNHEMSSYGTERETERHTMREDNGAAW